VNLTKIDPRVKLLVMICLSSAAVAASGVFILLALLAFTLLVLLTGGVRPGAVWVRLRVIFGLIIMLFILQCIFNRNGEPFLVYSGHVIVTVTGFDTAAAVCLRLLVISLGAMIVMTGEPRDYLLALTQWRVPYEIAFMVLAALRFLPMLREEARNVLCAAQMRGLQIKKAGLRKQAAAYTGIILPVVSGALRRAELLSIAMEARGFRAHPRRVSMRRLTMRFADWVYLMIFFSVTVGVFIIFILYI